MYGEAWVGGTIVDLSITENNQELYYVIAISEVTGNGSDTITFGDCYWGGKKVVFNADGYNVDSLLDESTGVSDTTVAGKLQFYFYKNGSNNPTNTSQTAITVMNTSGLVYKWDATKLMTNTAFVIVHLTYSQTANIRGLEQTKFKVINSRTDTGDVFYDYLTNTRYGAGIPSTQIDSTSLSALNTYSNQSFTYTDYNGVTTTQPRFMFNGVVDTSRSVMDNLQDMASCCDCLIKVSNLVIKFEQKLFSGVKISNGFNISLKSVCNFCGADYIDPDQKHYNSLQVLNFQHYINKHLGELPCQDTILKTN